MDNKTNFNNKSYSNPKNSDFNEAIYTIPLNENQNSNSEEIIDITNDFTNIIKEINLNGKNINEIIDFIEKNPNMKSFDSYTVKWKENYILLENDINDFEEHYIFKQNLTIYYKNLPLFGRFVTLLDKSVKSSFQIEKVIELYKTKYLIYEEKTSRKFPENKNTILEFINNGNLIINFLCPMEEPKYIYNNMTLNGIPSIININNLSIYSNFYLKYTNNNIEYLETKERNKLFSYLYDFIRIKNINIFKITGPSNDGKTLTLLLYSRLKNNIIYFNLKIIMNLYYSHNKDYLKVMMHELGRAYLSKDQIKYITQKFNENNFVQPWNLILDIINLFINEKKIIILDQFKEKTIDFHNFYKIEEEIIGKNLKIIICSSANDKMIKSKVLETIRNFHGNPNDLKVNYQKFYYYFNNILDKEKFKKLYKETNEYFNNFNYIPKYVYMLSNSDNIKNTLDDIKNHILKKIKENYIDIKVSINEILYLISRNINKQLNYIEDFNILTYISLKYFSIDFHEDFFIINYSFNYIKDIIDEIRIDDDVENFFQFDKANNSNFYRTLKPYYYEESCINALKIGNLLPQKLNKIDVKTIAELEEDEYKNSFNKDFLKQSVIEISLKEYYNLNLNTIKDTIKNKNLLNKEDKDINSYYFKTLKEKEKNIYELLQKKRFKQKNNDGMLKEVDIEKKKIKIYSYDNSFYNNGIIINQIKKGGKTLDFGFFFGNKDSKIFLGFQIKNYSKNVKLNHDTIKNLNKSKIKDSIKKILVQSLINYNIYIEEWHYFMISFYDPESKDYNQDIVNVCNKEGLEYMFYNPKTHIFYDRNFNTIEENIKLTFDSNLDYNINNNPKVIFENFYNLDSNFINYCKISNFNEKINNKANIFIKNVNKDINLKNLNRTIKSKLDQIKNLKLISIYNYSKNYPFPIPNNFYLLLFINNTCNDFIYYYKNENIFYCGYVLENGILNTCFLSNYVNTDDDKLQFLIYKFN